MFTVKQKQLAELLQLLGISLAYRRSSESTQRAWRLSTADGYEVGLACHSFLPNAVIGWAHISILANDIANNGRDLFVKFSHGTCEVLAANPWCKCTSLEEMKIKSDLA